MSYADPNMQSSLYGLIGFPLSHSFSKDYFTEKFERMKLDNHQYELFPLENIEQLPALIAAHPNLAGLNVTIPYKKLVMPFLDKIEQAATSIGAVNVIKIKDGQLIGFNSDAYGFELTLRGLIAKKEVLPTELQALVLGTGGASLAIKYVLQKLGIPFQVVSRTKKPSQITYEEIDAICMKKHRLVINCTPLGTYPNVTSFPLLPYDEVTENHFFYDLVYNPAESVFLKNAKEKGASTINGLAMLHLQAERSWEVWRAV